MNFTNTNRVQVIVKVPVIIRQRQRGGSILLVVEPNSYSNLLIKRGPSVGVIGVFRSSIARILPSRRLLGLSLSFLFGLTC